MVEHEIKSIISEAEMARYRNKLEGIVSSTRKLQANYYFDTLDYQLYTLSDTLRIRQINNQFVLQYKYDKCYTGAERISKEFEMKV